MQPKFFLSVRGNRVNINISAVSHKKALILALFGIVGALVISVTSFAATSSSTELTIGAGGTSEFGFTVGQTVTGTTAVRNIATVASGIQVIDAANFSVGDHVLIQDHDGGSAAADIDPADATATFRGYYTITAINGVDPEQSFALLNDSTGSTDASAIGTNAVISEPAVYDSSGSTGTTGFVTTGTGAGWTPAINSATSISPGNAFIVNLKGLTSSDSAFVEILNTNPNELVKNYTYLNRTYVVYVLCDSDSDCADSSDADPYTSGTVNAGSWNAASDVSGTTINAVGDLLTLANARVQFNLIGDYVYSITMDGGALFTIDTTTGTGDSLSPKDQIGITAR